MEGRLMLSVSSVSAQPAYALMAPAHSQIGNFAPIVGQSVSSSRAREGGYIDNSYTPVLQDGIDTTAFSVDQLHASDQDSTGAGSDVLMANTSLGSNGSVASLNSDNYAIHVMVDGGQPILNRFSNDGYGQEGGMTPIESIMVSMGPGAERMTFAPPSARNTVPTPMLGEVAVNVSAPISKSPTQEISGEWARAAVFEIAGGEPFEGLHEHSSYGQTNASPNQNVVPRDVQPTKAVDAEQDATHLAEQRSPAQRAIYALTADVGSLKQGAEGRQASHLAALTMRPDGATTAKRFGFELRDDTAEHVMQTNAPRQETASPAIDETDSRRASLVQPASEEQALRRSLGIVPLLLMLALERVALRNWIRNRRAKLPEQPRLIRRR